MKSFKQITEEVLNEGGEHYPADDMTISELKIACYAAQNILDKLEDGAMIQRWQISAIVKAKEELSSVYTSISADEQDEMDDVEAWLNGDEEEQEGEYVGFEYPSMYGEETKLDEGFKEKIKGIIRREKEKEYPLMQNRRDVAATKAGAAYATGDQKKGDRYMKWRSDNMNKEEVELDETSAFFHSEMDKLSKKAHANAAEKSKKSGPVTSKTLADINDKLGNTKKTNEETEINESFQELSNLKKRISVNTKKMKALPDLHPEKKKLTILVAKDTKKHNELFNKQFGKNEETDYEVDVEGLPKMFVKANSPAEVKNNLRKVVKNPEMIRGVERVAKATLQKIFRDKASGKEVAEEVELGEASDLRITKVYNKKKATYAVHSPDRKYYKEFDTMDAAKAHHAEKTGK